MTKILIATANKGKLREIQSILGGMGREFVLPADLGLDLDVVEDGQTYAENAAKKARAYAQASGLLSMADDSGLEVDALGGAPGLYSARYSPKPGATDADRRAYMLENLQGKPQPWPAHFHCTIALCAQDGELHFAEGDCHGQIIPEERGSNGFGYDPIFYIPELGCTMAELPSETKNRLSHRAQAIENAKPILDKLLSGQN